jgi:large subunit ribosomal protein L21
MFAVIKSGGRQYKVSVGEKLEVNRLPVDVGDQVRFEEVLLISDADKTFVGSPLINDAMVLATADEQGRGEKLIVFKYKSKKRYRHKRGHRQELTFLTIDDIVADGKSLLTGEAPVFREKGTTASEEETVEEVVETTTTETTAAGTTTTETTTTEAVVSVEETPGAEPEKKTRRRRTAKAEEKQAEE